MIPACYFPALILIALPAGTAAHQTRRVTLSDFIVVVSFHLTDDFSAVSSDAPGVPETPKEQYTIYGLHSCSFSDQYSINHGHFPTSNRARQPELTGFQARMIRVGFKHCACNKQVLPFEFLFGALLKICSKCTRGWQLSFGKSAPSFSFANMSSKQRD